MNTYYFLVTYHPKLNSKYIDELAQLFANSTDSAIVDATHTKELVGELPEYTYLYQVDGKHREYAISYFSDLEHFVKELRYPPY